MQIIVFLILRFRCIIETSQNTLETKYSCSMNAIQKRYFVKPLGKSILHKNLALNSMAGVGEWTYVYSPEQPVGKAHTVWRPRGKLGATLEHSGMEWKQSDTPHPLSLKLWLNDTPLLSFCLSLSVLTCFSERLKKQVSVCAIIFFIFWAHKTSNLHSRAVQSVSLCCPVSAERTLYLSKPCLLILPETHTLARSTQKQLHKWMRALVCFQSMYA